MHADWRKLAKKAQRQRKRRKAALIRTQMQEEEQHKKEQSPSYQKWLIEQQELEEFQCAEERRISHEQEALFQEREQQAQQKWEEVQQKLQIAKEARAKQNIKIKKEWEAEQRKLQLLKEEKEKLEEEKILNEQRLQQKIDEFINESAEMPEELNKLLETNPGKMTCPFFTRTGACRFGDMCSRNHIRPTVSCVLLIKNFYSHYSLDAKENEHGDSSLEFDSHEIYKHFKAFFDDVVPEFEQFGNVLQFKVCCNKEPHLRGNVFVGYENCRQAMKSYRRFQGRFYAGKQLNVEFCTIESWKAAICGLFYRKRCPKGSVCNFLHVFRNPGNMFTKLDYDGRSERRNERSVSKLKKQDDWNCSERGERKEWRWSSSPELVVPDGYYLKEIERDSENDEKSKNRSERSTRSERSRTSSRSSCRSPSRKQSRSHRKRSGHRSSSRRCITSKYHDKDSRVKPKKTKI